MPLKFGDHAILSPTGVDKKGRGTGLLENGKPFAIPFVAPGETADATFAHRDAGVRHFRVSQLTSTSPRRVTPRCAFFGKCGGCSWQQLDYAWQLELKRDLVNNAFAKAGRAERIESVEPCPDLYFYRNRMDYCVGPNGELGLKELGNWRNHLDLTECHLLSPDTPALMDAFRGWMKNTAVVPWNNRDYTGYARYLVIREGKKTGKRMALVVTAAGELPGSADLIERLKPFCTTIYHSINKEISDLSIGQELHLLHGEELLEDEVCGKRFLIHPHAFFQTNTHMAGRLLETVRGWLADQRPKLLLDLYCGVGLFGIALADTAERVVGVEIIPQAIEMAAKNAERNGVTNATFTAASAESLVWNQEQPDTVIIDPPRAGLHPKVVATLLERAPERIVYVSCNYESLVRDLAGLDEKYQVTKLASLDLFPHTPHLETVAMLVRK
jgi:23S rRNA (uracil-5-)-methyltransferase RumA